MFIQDTISIINSGIDVNLKSVELNCNSKQGSVGIFCPDVLGDSDFTFEYVISIDSATGHVYDSEQPILQIAYCDASQYVARPYLTIALNTYNGYFRMYQENNSYVDETISYSDSSLRKESQRYKIIVTRTNSTWNMTVVSYDMYDDYFIVGTASTSYADDMSGTQIPSIVLGSDAYITQSVYDNAEEVDADYDDVNNGYRNLTETSTSESTTPFKVHSFVMVLQNMFPNGYDLDSEFWETDFHYDSVDEVVVLPPMLPK